MNLPTKVEQARQHHNTGQPNEKRAGKVLLGKAERAELIEIAKEWGFFKSTEKMLRATGDARVEYCGLKVYLVDDDSYCEVAP